MDVAHISEIAGLMGFVIWALVERSFSLHNQQQSKGQSQDEGSYWLITMCWYGATLFSFLDTWSLRWTTFEVSLVGFQLIGIFLVASGIVIRILARKALGKYYSVYVETSDAHQLITHGIYGVLRHPAYLGLICLLIGIPVSEGSWGGILAALIGGIPAIANRIRIEEKSLSAWFGKEYEQYKTSTWRLIPYLW